MCLVNFIAVESNKLQVPNVLNVCGFVRDSGHKLLALKKKIVAKLSTARHLIRCLDGWYHRNCYGHIVLKQFKFHYHFSFMNFVHFVKGFGPWSVHTHRERDTVFIQNKLFHRTWEYKSRNKPQNDNDRWFSILYFLIRISE